MLILSPRSELRHRVQVSVLSAGILSLDGLRSFKRRNQTPLLGELRVLVSAARLASVLQSSYLFIQGILLSSDNILRPGHVPAPPYNKRVNW